MYFAFIFNVIIELLFITVIQLFIFVQIVFFSISTLMHILYFSFCELLVAIMVLFVWIK